MFRGVSVLPRFSHPPRPSHSFTRILMAKMSNLAAPLCPKFIPVVQTGITSISDPDRFKFSMVSYNILAQVYVKSAFFPHSPSACLKWKQRSQAVLSLLKNLEADFLCLQEVDEYYEFYKAKMEQTGYTGIYVQRNGQKRDGCGVFYKNDVAELVLHETIEYNDLVNTIISGSDLQADSSTCSLDRYGTPAAKTGVPAEKTEVSMQGSAKVEDGDPNDPRVRLKRDCVGILAAFQLKDPSRQIVIIANTHIYWDPEWVDVKLAQVKYLLSRLSLFKSLVSEKFDCTPSILVAGDFNSVPGDQVYQYLVSGGPSAIPPVQCEDELLIPLLSVYAHTRGEPTFTNCTPGFTGTLDYIFFSPSGCIKPISFLELPEADSSSVESGLPNHHHPSDHLPIGAEFEVISG
ncbi:Carbon catabolite repressor protein 4 homolog 4-like protein [Drosera capensis]